MAGEQIDTGGLGGGGGSQRPQQDEDDDESRRQQRLGQGPQRDAPGDAGPRNPIDAETDRATAMADPESDARPNDDRPPADDDDGTPGETQLQPQRDTGNALDEAVRRGTQEAPDRQEVQAADPGPLRSAVEDTRRRFRRDQEIEAEAQRDRTVRSFEPAVEDTRQRFQREQEIDAAKEADRQTQEQFGDSDGVLKDIENAIDPVADDIASRLRSQGQSFEETADAAAADQDTVSDFLPALSGVTRASAEIGEGLAEQAAGAAEAPSQAIEAQELTNEARDRAISDITTGSDDLDPFQQRLSDTSQRAADAQVDSIQEEPVDFATELAVGAATGTASTRAARLIGSSSRLGRAGSSVARQFRGVDRGQLGAPGGPKGDNVLDLDDVARRQSDDGGPEGDVVEQDAVEPDGDQLMLTRMQQRQRSQGDEVELTEQEQAATSEMTLEEGLAEIEAELEAEEAASAASQADTVAGTVGAATAADAVGDGAEATQTATTAFADTEAVDAAATLGDVEEETLATSVATTSDATAAFQSNVAITSAITAPGTATATDTALMTDAIADTGAVTDATTDAQTLLTTPTPNRPRRPRLDLDVDVGEDSDAERALASDTDRFRNFVSTDLDRAIEGANFEVDL